MDKPNPRQGLLESQPIKLASIKSAWESDQRGAATRKRIAYAFFGALGALGILVVVALATGNFVLAGLLPLPIGLLAWVFLESRRNLKDFGNYESKLHDMGTELEDKNRQLRQLVQTDALTSVLNRRGLEKALSTETNRAKRSGKKNAAILVDCDDFKSVNETLGHAGGDAVLQEMAARMRKAVRPVDYVSRVGGDEFIILLSEVDLDTALQVAERVRLSICDGPVKAGDKETMVSSSLGVTMLPKELCTIEEILTAARMGLKHSKSGGKNRVSTADLGKSAEEERTPLAQLLSGAENFRPFKQPIVRLRDGAVVASEVYCLGPAGPFEMPENYFRLALEQNQLTSVDLKCLRTLLSAAKRSEKGKRVHLNLYPGTLLDIPVEEFPALFSEMSSNGGLCIEISGRQMFADATCLLERIVELKRMGAQILLDDIGSGRSTIEHMMILEPNQLKIGQAVSQHIGSQPVKRKQLERLVAIANSMNATIIADGVKSKDDEKVLLETGVEYGQGLIYGASVEMR
ncbi:MAG TPA: sensor domain-containing diguanylate cyclase [Candidatus Melainabacteria bacterium]|jgi:diguanylate cyclase (GGDEF)-like protein|nr:sensor domain-containing diguanylate cyclase [Candidatus Melainabacteria bacterium]HIN67136.1 sensor domain-containing diguanylate cyclase [Candidatus Obscuribacterales bacterium]